MKFLNNIPTMILADLTPNSEIINDILSNHIRRIFVKKLHIDDIELDISAHAVNERVNIQSILQNGNLDSVFDEYGLSIHKSDLLKLIIICEMIIAYSKAHRKKIDNYSTKKKELLLALRYFYVHRNITIDFKNIQNNNSESIIIPEFVDAFKENLVHMLFKLYPASSLSKKYTRESFEENALSIIDEYLDNIPYKPRKGRKRQYNVIGDYIWTLHQYLEKYTVLKSDSNVLISRKQASFIYKILNEFKLFPNELNWGEDKIRHLYVDYMKFYKYIMLTRENNDKPSL
jgi:hypothetical protein